MTPTKAPTTVNVAVEPNRPGSIYSDGPVWRAASCWTRSWLAAARATQQYSRAFSSSASSSTRSNPQSRKHASRCATLAAPESHRMNTATEQLRAALATNLRRPACN